MHRSPALRGLVVPLIVLAVTGGIGLVPGMPVAVGGHATGVGGSVREILSPGRGGIADRTGHPPMPAGPGTALSGRCAILAPRFGELYPGPAEPPTLASGWNAGCAFGNDEAGLGLLSNASASGARVALGVTLPSAAGGASRGLLAYEVRQWVSGVPCSVGGASLLSIDLLPPFDDAYASNASNWSVWAPVYDLVPAGACDPTCQNTTALFTLPGTGRSFCEDDAVVRGVASGTSELASVSPGDALDLTLVGGVGGSSGLTVFLNDTTHPAADRSWQYGAGQTISRQALEPLHRVSNTSSTDHWAAGPALTVVAGLCPAALPPASPPGTACNSYDGPRVNASEFPQLTSVRSWNSTLGAYADPYPWVAAYSASGACSGTAGASPCPDFATGGGTANYPFWSLVGGLGTLRWQFGGPSKETVADWGGPTQFNTSGALAVPAPVVGVSGVINVSASTVIDIRARVTAPAGIGSVDLSVYFCTVQATVPTVTTVPVAEDPGAWNTSTDGNFSAGVPFAHSERGTVFYWLTVASAGGGSVRAGPWRSVIPAGGNACVDAAPPVPAFAAANVTSIAGGFRLNVSSNDPAVTNYTLRLTPTPGPGTPLTRSLTTTGPVDVFVPAATTYNFSLTATDVAGLTSAASPTFNGSTGIAPLSLTATTPSPDDLWIGADTAAVNLTAAGGVAPYTFRVDFGNGTSVTLSSGGPYENLTHDFGPIPGVALLRATVTDAEGVTAAAVPLGISVRAGPLGVNQSLSAGAFVVRLAWSPPVSPASPVTGYTVFYTNRSGEAPTVADLWADNATAVGGFLWNTTATYLDLPNVDPGAPVYAVVVAWNALGIGTLPSGWLQTPSALPLNLSASPITVTPTGGPAPLTVQVSDTITLGTNGTLVEGLYSFGTSGSAPAALASNTSGEIATWWLNSSWTFPTTGTDVIVLHAADALSDTVIPVTSVYVGPASAPSAVARITSGTPLVAQPVEFEGIAGGGTGVYTFNWTFGDGGNGTGPTPAHVYASAGNYTAILEVTDSGDGLTTLAPVNLTVYANPSVFIEASATGSSGLSYQFTAIETGGVGGLTFAWVFGDGSTASGPSANHSFAAPGVFNVSVTVTDSLRHTAVAGIVVVAPTPPATTAPETPPLTGAELAAYALLGALIVLLFIGLLYYWSKSREPPEGPPPPDRFSIEPRVRAPPPPDPPDPS